MTISMMGILLTIGSSTFVNQTRTQSVNAAVEQVAFALKQARHHSRIKGVTTEVILTNNKSNYTIQTDDETITNSANSDATSGELPDGTKVINNYCGNINFYVDGSPVDSYGYPMYDCTITVGYENSIQKTLTLKAISGNITYEL